jgi:hypothetical protein
LALAVAHVGRGASSPLQCSNGNAQRACHL